LPSDKQTTDDAESAWGYPSPGESRWPPTVAVVVALVIYLRLPDKLTPGPQLAVPVLEVILLIPLVATSPFRITDRTVNLRWLSICLIALVNAANGASLVLLVRYLLHGGQTDGRTLIRAGIGIWVTQVLVFALWYWEVDRGGPVARCSVDHGPPDLLFPQMQLPAVIGKGWYPRFWDYLYVSLTNSTAFSPTDTMPLSTRAKLMMSVQCMSALVISVLVIAKAVGGLQ